MENNLNFTDKTSPSKRKVNITSSGLSASSGNISNLKELNIKRKSTKTLNLSSVPIGTDSEDYSISEPEGIKHIPHDTQINKPNFSSMNKTFRGLLNENNQVTSSFSFTPTNQAKPIVYKRYLRWNKLFSAKSPNLNKISCVNCNLTLIITDSK